MKKNQGMRKFQFIKLNPNCMNSFPTIVGKKLILGARGGMGDAVGA